VDRPWRIVIPLRLSDAKSRLSAQPAPRRRQLVVAMALDVIAAATACPVVGDVVLVADADGIASVTTFTPPGLHAVEDPGTGLNAAIESAAAGASGPVAALLADVPCATPAMLAAALAACAAGPAIVSDAEGIGTTLLGAPRAADLRPHFGPRSRAAHIAAGARDIPDSAAGALAGLRRDVDSEVDLWDARRIGLGAYTAAVVEGT
jgi:2-phospho-L-lactate/phosphoenolpyruvate guanylyltransferase